MDITLTDVALGFPGLFIDKIIPAVCGDDAKDCARLDCVSKLFHAPSQIMNVTDGMFQGQHTVSMIERALRGLSEQAGRGVRGVALPPTVAGPPLPNWTQVLLRELRRGFWQKGGGLMDAGTQDDAGGRASHGAFNSLYATADGKAYSCGSGPHMCLGHDNNHSQLYPKLIEGLAGVHVVAVSAGYQHSLFLTEDGAVYSCGDGGFGRLGHGNVNVQWVPKRIDALRGLRIRAISAGSMHSLFLTDGGVVFSCGISQRGELGHGNRETQTCPKRIEALDGLRVCSVAAGGSHSIFLTEDGAVYICGRGEMGRLGIGPREAGVEGDQLTPVIVESLTRVRVCAMAAGGNHNMYRTEGGAVLSCGQGRNGVLGHGDRVTRDVPCRIEALKGVRVRMMSCGDFHSLFVAQDGTVLSCGSDLFGSLGHGDEAAQLVPKRVEALKDVKICTACAGHSNSAYLAADGSMFSSGCGGLGRLGHGATQHQPLPKLNETLSGRFVTRPDSYFAPRAALGPAAQAAQEEESKALEGMEANDHIPLQAPAPQILALS